MNVFTLIYNMLITPLVYLFQFIFIFVYSRTLNFFVSTFILSLCVNVLTLPLYNRADIMQKNEFSKKRELEKWEKHIKKTFKGEEKFMMLQTYYRQKGYKPYQSLNGVLPLLLEIPFFVAAYSFLSGLNLITGVSLWRIADLSQPDKLISFSGVAINILPIIMTIINLLSVKVYSDDISLKNKLQLYVFAIIFLILLYNSPSLLCIYWIMNNLFSLIKNIIYRIISHYKKENDRETKESDKEKCKKEGKKLTGLFIFALLHIVLFAGLFIPSKIIASAPEDFFEKSLSVNPSYYIMYSVVLYAGIFLFWGGMVYYLSNEKVRNIIVQIVIMLSLIFIFDYVLMGDMGMMTKYFTYVSAPTANILNNIRNIVVIISIIVLVHFIYKKKAGILNYFVIAGGIIFLALGLLNVYKISTDFNAKRTAFETRNNNTEIHLSKNGKNVVVIMMDRMVGQFIPYFLNEKPELMESFSGFTYYNNVVSFGNSTNTGTPGLYGGYEYIPQENNKKTDVSLKENQNEALKVMPVLFLNNGYNVRVSDPTYAGYNWIPDLSIYDEYPEIATSITMGMMSDNNELYNVKELCSRNAFFNSLLNVLPSFFKPLIYEDGNYYNPNRNYNISYQETRNNHVAYGISDDYYDSYCVLNKMENLTYIDEDTNNNFFMMSNDLTHSPCILKLPEYEPQLSVDNTQYDSENPTRTDLYGNTIYFDDNDERTTDRLKEYHAQMSAMIKLAKWLDYLKEQDVYDNTRIIIVSDHAADEFLYDDFVYLLKFPSGTEAIADLFRFQCTLLVKDFDSKEFSVNDEFMTNADVPVIAMEGLIDNKINPFTGKEISTKYKTENELQLNYTINASIDNNKGNVYLPEHWFSVHDNIFDINNWKYLGYY